MARFFTDGITGDSMGLSWLSSSPNSPLLDDRNTRARLVVISELGFRVIDTFLEQELEEGKSSFSNRVLE